MTIKPRLIFNLVIVAYTILQQLNIWVTIMEREYSDCFILPAIAIRALHALSFLGIFHASTLRHVAPLAFAPSF